MIESRPGPRPGLYQRLLGTAWCELDEAVRRAHGGGAVVRAVGSLRISHGAGRLTRLVLHAARVPPPSSVAEVRLVVMRRGSAERWQRSFDGTRLVTVQRAGPGGLLAEHLGALELRFRLVVAGGALVYRQVGLALWLGPFRLPLPNWLGPRVAAREAAAGGPDRTRVAVAVTTPSGGLLFSYEGSIRWEERSAS